MSTSISGEWYPVEQAMPGNDADPFQEIPSPVDGSRPCQAFTPQPTNTAHFLLTALRSMLGASRALHRGITVIRSEKKLI